MMAVRKAPAPAVRLDVQRAELLVSRRVAGDLAAGLELMDLLCGFLGPALDRTRLLAARRSEDAPREVMTRVLEKLARNDAQALRQYLDWRRRHERSSFQDWLVIVMMNAAREHVREQNGRGRRDDDALSRKRLLNEYQQLSDAPELGARPPFTPLQTARQMVEFARAHLPPPQVDALERWLEGAELDEVAAALSLPSADAARRLVRAATATLRRRFVEHVDRPRMTTPPRRRV